MDLYIRACRWNYLPEDGLVRLLRVLGGRHELLRHLDPHELGVGAEGGELLGYELGPDHVLLVHLEGEALLSQLQSYRRDM